MLQNASYVTLYPNITQTDRNGTALSAISAAYDIIGDVNVSVMANFGVFNSPIVKITFVTPAIFANINLATHMPGFKGNVITIGNETYTYKQLPVDAVIPYNTPIPYSFFSPLYPSAPRTRYIYNYSSGCGNIPDSGYLIVSQNCTVNVYYTLQYWLALNTSPIRAGIVPNSLWVNASKNYILSETPNPGYCFQNWDGTGSYHYKGTDPNGNVLPNEGNITDTAFYTSC